MKTKLPLYKMDGKDAGEISGSEEIFGRKANQAVVHSALVWYLASQRRGTQSAKTRAEVRGGGAKPWRQKGTGRARAGSNRSPLWRKGGVIFAPKPRDYGYSLPRKIRKLALKVALSDKAKARKVKTVEELKVSEPKTKLAAKIMKDLKLSGKTLIVLGQENQAFEKAARNLEGVKLLLAKDLNIFDLLNAEWMLTEKSAIARLEEVLG
ncbi:MAG: 50S ribosomal protein L4 [Candidatus Margulisiibacteriota bacterium]